MSLLQVTILVLLIEIGLTTAVPTVDHCLNRFEESLKHTIDLKRSCAEANLRDCCQVSETYKLIEESSPKTGVYDISNVCQDKAAFTQDLYPPMQARCNMESDNGGWTVLVRRTANINVTRENFARTWEEYEEGFGDLDGEFWYGLKNMHCLTSREKMEVQVEFKNPDGSSFFQWFGNFKIDGPETSYTMRVSEKLDSGKDYMTYHNGVKFSTKDRDNDGHGSSCSASYGNGGGWFKSCYYIHLTDNPDPNFNDKIFYKSAEMRVRPRSCRLVAEKQCESSE